jgi:hypothetical protein
MFIELLRFVIAATRDKHWDPDTKVAAVAMMPATTAHVFIPSY